MPPTVTSLGSTFAVTSSATLVLTITANVAIGETIFVASAIGLNTGTETMAITDSGVNTWVKDVEHQHTSGVPSGALHRSVCTVALTSGSSTLTLTVSGTVNERMIGAFKTAVGDVLTPIVTDGSNSNEGTTSTSATPGSVTPTFNPDFGVMMLCVGAAAIRTGTPPANWTEMFDFGATGGIDNLSMQMNRLTNFTSSNTALNDTETISAAPTAWVDMQVLYKSIAATTAFAHIVVVDSAVAQSTSR
jgi:hypothetical protein